MDTSSRTNLPGRREIADTEARITCAPWCTTNHPADELAEAERFGDTLVCVGDVASGETWGVQIEGLVDAAGTVSQVAVYVDGPVDGRITPEAAEAMAAALTQAAATVREVTR